MCLVTDCSHIVYQLPSRSPYRSAVNAAIERVKESGLMEIYFKWTSYYLLFIFKPMSTPADRSKSSVLTVDMLWGVFVLYLIGLSLAVVAFVAENVCRVAVERRIYQ